MTDTNAAEARPGPWTGHPGDGSRPDHPHLRVVPAPAPEMPTSGNPEEPPAETISAGQSGSPVEAEAATSESGFRVALAATRDYWTPPAVFTGRPASLADLATYAKHGPWTSQSSGIARSFGVWYHRTIGYPTTVTSRYWEWFVQRPLRFAALLGGIKLASMTGPGAWVIDTVIYPAAHIAGHIFL